MFKQKYRKECLNAIKEYYPGREITLMADRAWMKVYYSVWHLDDDVLEVTDDNTGTIRIYHYRQMAA